MLASSTSNHILYRRILNRVGWSMLLFTAVFNLLNTVPVTVAGVRDYITSPLWHNLVTALYGILAAICYITPFFLAGTFFYAISRRLRTERPALEIRLAPEFPLLIFAGMAILTAGAYVNGWFCNIIGYTMPTDMILSESYDVPSTIIMYMSVAVAPAFAEEFLFRGVFYANLRPFGRTQAVLISSLLFALMHQNIGQLFYTFVAGIAMALMYELTGSIWCSVFFHLLNNQMAVLSEVINYGWYGEASLPYLTILDAILLLLGIISIVLLVLHYKKQTTCQKQLRHRGIWGAQTEPVTIASCDAPMSASHVVKGALSPGMIAFTVEAVANMLATWLLLEFINEGILW